jgi:hypothetical protein
MKHFAVLSLLIFCASCASAPWQELPLPPKQFVLKGFSFTPPNEMGWYVTHRRPDHLLLEKSNHDKDPYETYAIEAFFLNVHRVFKSNEEFLQAVKEGVGIKRDPRYKILKHDMNLHKKNGESCALAQVVAEDHGRIPSFGFGIHRRPGHMILEMIEFTCRHPQNNSIAINMIFALRYYPGERDSLFSEKAMKVVDSVGFQNP